MANAKTGFYGRDAEKEFGDPRQVAVASDLSLREKREILANWRADLIELQRAEEENMPSTNADTGAIGARLSEVTAAIDTLQTQQDEVAAGAPPGDSGR